MISRNPPDILSPAISDQVDWQQKSYTISTRGVHTLSRRYATESRDRLGNGLLMDVPGITHLPESSTASESLFSSLFRA